MKKTVAVLISVLCVVMLVGCNGNIEVGSNIDKIDESYEKLYSVNAVSAYTNGEEHIVIIDIDGDRIVDKTAIFNAKRELIDSDGIEPIKSADLDTLDAYYGRTVSELDELFGEAHVDTGSGFYVNAYVTDDAHIVYFSVQSADDIIGAISKIDLFSGEQVERDTKWKELG